MSNPPSPALGAFGLPHEQARTLLRLAVAIPVGVPAVLYTWVLLARHYDWDVVESARRAAACGMVYLAATLAVTLTLRYERRYVQRGFIVFWFSVASFFNLTWQVPLILFRDTITTAAPTHDNLARFVAWWGYGFADSHYGQVSRWMVSEELWWLMAIAISLRGLWLLRRGDEARAFLALGIAGALESYNASLYIVYDLMTGLENVPSGSTTSLVLYWGFNPLWAGAALLASVYSFRFVLERATSSPARAA